MNALDLLRNQHREIEGMFDKLKEESDGRARKQILSQLASMLMGHTAIEERLFYPSSQKMLTGDEHGQEKVLEFYEEHSLVKTALESLMKTPTNDKRWMARCKVLEELFHTHIQEEEQELFARLEDEMGAEDLERLGTQLERRYQTETSKAPTKRTAKRGTAKRAPARAGAKRGAAKRATTKRATTKRATTKRAPAKRAASATTRGGRGTTTTKRRRAGSAGGTTKRRGRGRTTSSR